MAVNKSKKSFTISIDGDFTLSVDALWPDGDAPENPTPEDVRKLVEKCGGISRVLRDWNLLDDEYFDVRDDSWSPEMEAELRAALEQAKTTLPLESQDS